MANSCENDRMTTRRHFIQRTAAAAGTAVLLGRAIPAGAAGEKPSRDLKKALKIGMVRIEGSLTDKFKLLKQLGFHGVELNSPSSIELDEVKRAKEASGLLVPGVVDSVHWRQRLSDPDPAVRAVGVEALRQAIKDAKAYGGTSVLLVPGRVTPDANYEQCWTRSQAEIKKVLPLAEDEGIHVLIENVWNDFLTDAKEMARYLDELGSPMAGAYFDVGNAVRYAPPVEWIKTLGDRIVKLDIKEYSLEKGKENKGAGFRVKLGEGDFNWPAVMKQLDALGYRGCGSAEVAGGGKERLQEISDRMDRIFSL